jgi:hypothetical protein
MGLLSSRSGRPWPRFSDYVTSWSSLGYPEVHRYSNFYNDESGTLDVAGKTAQFWLEWLNRDR